MFRRLSDVTGLKLGAGMQRALSRMESGKDLEKVEEDLGELPDEEDPFIIEKRSRESVCKNKPMLDDKLYVM
jgi:CRISPR/Cas system-associated protein Cas10 (large subunit of type III CRISPR-Cas system)